MKKYFTDDRYLPITILIIGIVFFGALGVIELFFANIPCVFKEITGLYCPGCGLTRASYLLMEGRFYAAFRMNPLAMTILPLCVIWLIVWGVRARKGLSAPPLPWWIGWAMLALIVLFTIFRNINFLPFSWLAPTSI